MKTDETPDPVTLQRDFEELEFQVFRMQQNLKEIAKKWQVIGIDQPRENRWVIIYALDDGHSCRVMLNDCEAPYRGQWDFCIQAQYIDEHTIHIGDIKGEENRGYGSVCMYYLKEIARKHNIQFIQGDIAERDWGHLDRLIHFYKKHNFQVQLTTEQKTGKIICNTN
ncbi:GNAT family N-acetyltransferase [Desertibacillus haloalkaliphilus]|uniref:GNAT family N-acetyltransferase n=1 Tax=Desertibacillus haloalkaliphilus TaxID=1328930 RepID=UPI001C27ACAF|nr:GNAT family N-acetyltransferase [Desertibacillus haloalkaliphilus]MBU8907955.1 GNAT family N-acetyltransferase [Desertibacillus haloalkaliphilus]